MRTELEARAEEALDRAEEIAAELDEPPPLVELAHEFGLTRFELLTVALLAAWELDRGSLCPDLDPRAGPTLETALGSLPGSHWSMCTPDAPLRGARLEMVTFRCRSSAVSRKPTLVAAETLSEVIAPDAQTGTREIWWAEQRALTPTPIYDGYKLVPGNRLDGPCVVETTTTSMVVHPGQRIEVDALGNFVIDPNA